MVSGDQPQRQLRKPHVEKDIRLYATNPAKNWHPRTHGIIQPFEPEADNGLPLYSTGGVEERLYGIRALIIIQVRKKRKDWFERKTGYHVIEGSQE